jgi:methyl-accepting chemotaxis protein
LTTQQADAFKALSAALEVSAERVSTLNEALDEQSVGIEEIVDGIEGIEGVLDCVGERLTGLTSVSERVPGAVAAVARILGDVERTQRKSIRHLKSINRKMAALGVAAEATNVEAPPSPDIPSIDLPQQGGTDVDC